MRILYVIAFLIMVTMAGQVSAQIRATTASGNKVLLYPDGTWKYDEGQLSKDTLPVPAKVVSQTLPKLNIKVDSTAVDSTLKQQILNVASPRLAHFFGEEQGRMRCSAACINKKGTLMIRLEWAAAVGDANRYFGYLKDMKGITFHLDNGKSLKFQFNPGFENLFLQKYNISYYNGTITLKDSDVVELLTSPVISIDVDWKKAPEQYNVTDTQYFMKNLPKVM